MKKTLLLLACLGIAISSSANSGVRFVEGFECEKGAILEVK